MVSEASPHIVIADDHPLFRGALRQAVAGSIGKGCMTEVGSFADLSAALSANPDIDLVLLDLTMPGVQGFSGLLYMRAAHPEIPVIIVSANDDPGVIKRCIEFGASGFLPKTTETSLIGQAVTTVLDGGNWMPPGIEAGESSDSETLDTVRRLSSLTPQQVRVLMMLSEGLLNKQIAYELSVSEATIKAHVSAILQKLGVDSRTQAVITASRIAGTAWSGIGSAT